MTWAVYHRRADVLRNVVDEANSRCDGTLPVDVPGVAEAFADDVDLVGALHLRWHTRLAGAVDTALLENPTELDAAVLEGWRRTARDMPGVRAVLDRCAQSPTSETMRQALSKASRNDWSLMAAMAGRASASDPRAAAAGRALEEEARAGLGRDLRDARQASRTDRTTSGGGAKDVSRGGVGLHRAESLLNRLRARLVA